MGDPVYGIIEMNNSLGVARVYVRKKCLHRKFGCISTPETCIRL